MNDITRALVARKFVTRNGQRVDLDPDHRVRLKAVALLQELLRAMSACQADDRSQANMGTYQFFRKLHSIAEKIPAFVPLH